MGPDERKRFEEWLRQQRADMEERRAVGGLRRPDPITILDQLETLAQDNAAAIRTVTGALRRFEVFRRGTHRLWIDAGAHVLRVDAMPEAGSVVLTGYRHAPTRIGEGDPVFRAPALDREIRMRDLTSAGARAVPLDILQRYLEVAFEL
jgi:hypothetical protein